MKRSMKRKAFTIIEMTIVIAVIAILATVMIPTIGGMIEKAYVSTDTQFAASLNIQLALWEVDKQREIESEGDLREAINDIYNEGNPGYFEALTPSSGKYGYHYWYDVENGQVLLSTYEKLVGNGAAPAAESDVTFSPSSPRSLLINGKNYYLMDQAGTEEILELSKLDKPLLTDAGVYGEILNKLKAFGEEDNLYTEIWNKLQKTAIANNFGIFATNTETILELHIPVSATLLNGTPRVLNGNTVDLSNVQSVVLPEGVKVGSYSLLGLDHTNDDVVLLTSVEDDIAKIKEYFAADSVDCWIELSNGRRIKLSDIDGLTPSQVLGSFDLSISSDVSRYKEVGDTLYLASNFTGDITLSLNNLKDEDGNSMYATGARCETSINAATFNETKSDSNANTVVVTVGDISEVKSFDIVVYLLNVPETIHVEVVHISRIYVDYATYSSDLHILLGNESGSIVSGQENEAEMILTLSYENINSTWGFVPSYVQTPLGVDVGFSAKDIDVSVTGDYLTYDAENSCFKLNKLPDNNFQGTLTLSFGSLTRTYTIRLVKKTASTFAIDARANTAATYKTTDASGNRVALVYTVGSKNAFKLNYLFDIQGDTTATTIDGGKFYIDILNANATSYITGNSIECSSLDDMLTLPATLNDKTVIIRISTDNKTQTNYVDLKVNVVDAVNVGTPDEWKAVDNDTSIVLLNDLEFLSTDEKIEVSLEQGKNMNNGYYSGKTYFSKNLKAKTIYGNLHKIDIPDNFKIKSYYGGVAGADSEGSNNFFLYLAGGTLRDLIVDGPVYDKASNTYTPSLLDKTASEGYYVAGVETTGGNIINSYISGFRSPVRLDSNALNMTDSTLVGGAWANVYVKGGTLNVKNVTMIQSANGDNMGGGIHVDSNVTLNLNLVTGGTFVQETYYTINDVTKLPFTSLSVDLDGFGSSVSTITHGNALHAGVVLDKTGAVCNLNANMKAIYSSALDFTVTYTNSEWVQTGNWPWQGEYQDVTKTESVGKVLGLLHASDGGACGNVHSSYTASDFLDDCK